jgi:hypothetical protein
VSGSLQTEFARQLTETIRRYRGDRNRHKYLALALKISTSLFGAVATVMLGWQHPESPDTMKNAALVLTSAVTLFAAYDAFFEPRKLWVRETVVLNSLKDVQRKWELAVAGGQSVDAQVPGFSIEVDKILTTSLTEWAADKKKS